MARSADDPKKGRDKKLPTGKEIMKRRTPNDLSLRPARFEFDPKKAYTTEQLAEILAISVKWNQIEPHIAFVGSFILFNKSPFWLQLSTGIILGTKAKLNLLKECIKNADQWAPGISIVGLTRFSPRKVRTFSHASEAAGSLSSSHWPRTGMPGCNSRKLKPWWAPGRRKDRRWLRRRAVAPPSCGRLPLDSDRQPHRSRSRSAYS